MGITEERIERIKKQAEILESCGKAAGGMSSELGALLQDNQQMEQQIELLNEANDRLRERLNRSENHDGYIEPPLDADGVPLRIGDVVYAEDGAACRVHCITFREDGYLIETNEEEVEGQLGFLRFFQEPDSLTHRAPEPADSWEKLEKDVYHAVMTDFIEDPEEEVRDLIRRAKGMVG